MLLLITSTIQYSVFGSIRFKSKRLKKVCGQWQKQPHPVNRFEFPHFGRHPALYRGCYTLVRVYFPPFRYLSGMKRWVTEIRAIDPLNPERGLVTWGGPDVEAESFDAAEKWCRERLGYCRVIGELVVEIPWSVAEYAEVLFGAHRDN